MINSADRRASEKTEREAKAKNRRRAEQAAVVEGLTRALDSEEQLLGFARGRIAGGWRGKLNVGPEAFFAPHVNIGLTERRVILQHIHPDTGKVSEMMPHYFSMSDVAELIFTDIETFGQDLACRLVLRLNNDQHFRLRLNGRDNFESAQAMVEVFHSLTTARRKTAAPPTQTLCPNCQHTLDRLSKFCPYCGTNLQAQSAAPEPAPTTESAPMETPAAEDTAPGVAFVPENSTAPSTVEEAVANVTVVPDAEPQHEVFTPPHADFAAPEEPSIPHTDFAASETVPEAPSIPHADFAAPEPPPVPEPPLPPVVETGFIYSFTAQEPPAHRPEAESDAPSAHNPNPDAPQGEN